MANLNEKAQQQFLVALADGHTVKHAAAAAGVARSTVYDLRDRDQAFAERWRAAEAEGTEVLEQEARRRAVEGVRRHRYDKDGNLLVDEIVYSDTLLIFLLKARRPETYRENHRVEHTGTDGAPIEVRLAFDPTPE